MMDICALRLAVAFLVDHWPDPFPLILTVGPTLCKSFLCMYHIIIACKWKKPWVLPECVCVGGMILVHVNSITASGLASSLRKRSIDMVTRMLPRGLKPLSHLPHYFSAPSIRKKLKCRGQEYWFWVGGGKAHQTGGCQKGTTFLWFSTSHWSHLCWTSASMGKPVRRSWRNRCSPLAHFAVWSLLTDVSWAFGSQVLSMNVLFFLWAQTFGSVGEDPAIATSLKKPLHKPLFRDQDSVMLMIGVALFMILQWPSGRWKSCIFSKVQSENRLRFSFPTTLCGVLVFDSVSRAPSPPPAASLTHTIISHTQT